MFSWAKLWNEHQIPNFFITQWISEFSFSPVSFAESKFTWHLSFYIHRERSSQSMFCQNVFDSKAVNHDRLSIESSKNSSSIKDPTYVFMSSDMPLLQGWGGPWWFLSGPLWFISGLKSRCCLKMFSEKNHMHKYIIYHMRATKLNCLTALSRPLALSECESQPCAAARLSGLSVIYTPLEFSSLGQ